MATPSIQVLNAGSRLTFVEVPDMAVDGAFGRCMDGISYVIHVASPWRPKAAWGVTWKPIISALPYRERVIC